MTTRIPPTPGSLSLKFGLGVNSAASACAIDPLECIEGKNCLLRPNNCDMITRPPFDFLGSVPNGQAIRGFAFLHHSSLPNPSMLIQAGGSVYEWDGTDSSSAPFSLVGVCNPGARLRGHINSHQWPLSIPRVIITDLELQQPIMTWNGTSLVTPIFHNNDSTSFGNFYAKYCTIRNERAFYGAIRDPGGNFEHLLVGSEIEDFETINSTLGSPSARDAFFLPMPDLQDINGLVQAYGILVISTVQGALWKLLGLDATDFSIDSLFPGSAATGDEGVTFVGNDVAFGRQGRVESLISTDQFGDVAADDLTLPISDLVAGVSDWTIVYNSRLQRIYCFADGGPRLWVFFKDVAELSRSKQGSPWMLWTTEHSLNFTPTCVMNGYDPLDGLEYVFMGDSNGNLYRLEGTYNSGGDGGSAAIEAERLSVLFSSELDALLSNFQGWIRAKSTRPSDFKIGLEYVDEAGFTKDEREFTIQDPFGTVYYYGGSVAAGDAAYYGGTEEMEDVAYYSKLGRGPFTRYRVGFEGSGYDFQVRTTIDGDTEATIGEVGLRFNSGR